MESNFQEVLAHLHWANTHGDRCDEAIAFVEALREPAASPTEAKCIVCGKPISVISASVRCSECRVPASSAGETAGHETLYNGILAALMTSLIEQNCPDSVSAYKVMDEIIKYLDVAMPVPSAAVSAEPRCTHCNSNPVTEGHALGCPLYRDSEITGAERTPASAEPPDAEVLLAMCCEIAELMDSDHSKAADRLREFLNGARP